MCSTLLSNQIRSVVSKTLFKVWKELCCLWNLLKRLSWGLRFFLYVSSKNPEIWGEGALCAVILCNQTPCSFQISTLPSTTFPGWSLAAVKQGSLDQLLSYTFIHLKKICQTLNLLLLLKTRMPRALKPKVCSCRPDSC